MRHLDHIVWPTRDLGALADTFQRIGFTVGRRNRHPWGTENHIVQFDGCFLELLGFAADYRPVRPEDPAFPFANFCAAMLDGSAGGAAMLVLQSDDAAADATSFRAKGLGEGRLLPFSRAAQGPDGSDRTVAFTVAFANLPGLEDVGAFTCQQHRPENFWNPAAQRHPNGAVGIGAVVIETAHGPSALTSLRTFAGETGDASAHTEDAVPLDNSSLRIVAAPSAGPNASGRSCITALHVAVSDVALLATLLKAADIPHASEAERVTVAAAVAGGTGLVFGAKH